MAQIKEARSPIQQSQAETTPANHFETRAQVLSRRGKKLRDIVDATLKKYEERAPQNGRTVFVVGHARVEIPTSVKEQRNVIGRVRYREIYSLGGEYDGYEQKVQLEKIKSGFEKSVKLPHEQAVTIDSALGIKVKLAPAKASTATWSGEEPGKAIYPPPTIVGPGGHIIDDPKLQDNVLQDIERRLTFNSIQK